MEQTRVSARACVPELLAVPSQGIKLDIFRRHRTAPKPPSSAAACRRRAVKLSSAAVSSCSDTRSTVKKATLKGRAHARRQTVEYGVFVHPLVLSSGARHGPRIARPHGVNVLKLELSASTTIQARAATGAEELVTQEELPAEPDSGSEGSSTPLCPPWRPAGARPRSSLSPR